MSYTIITGVLDFFTSIGNAIGQVITGIKSIFNLIIITIQFIPQPFLNITLIFIPVLVACIMYKSLRG